MNEIEYYERLIRKLLSYRKLQVQYFKTRQYVILQNAKETAIVVDDLINYLNIYGSLPETIRLLNIASRFRKSEKRYFESREQRDLISVKLIQKELDEFLSNTNYVKYGELDIS